jgi:hypothetical protein
MIKIIIKTGNDAFSENYEGEVARILREIADNIEEGYSRESFNDINGNKVCMVDYDAVEGDSKKLKIKKYYKW